MDYLSTMKVMFHQNEFSIGSKSEPNVIPNILLSQVSSIPREIISEFENLQIFDLEDLLDFEEKNSDISTPTYLNISKIKKKVIDQSLKVNNIPILTLEIPKNYAIIAIENIKSKIKVGLTWKGLLFRWLDINIREMDEFLINFNILLNSMNKPELITDCRTWSYSLMKDVKPSDLSVFLLNFDVFSTLEEYCLKLNKPENNDKDTQNLVINTIDQIEFILSYAIKMKN